MQLRRGIVLLGVSLAFVASAHVASAQGAARPELAAGDVLADSTRATPFGLRMGLTRAELTRLGPLELLPNGFSLLPSVPRPHEAFEGYAVLFSESQGLCKIVAAGVTLKTKSEGSELKAAFQKLESELGQRFGNHLTLDSLRVGSRLQKPKDWMTALQRGERALSAYWDRDERSSLPPQLTAVALEAVATSKSEGYVKLKYDFANVDACLTELGLNR